MINGTLKEMDKQLELFIPNYVVTHQITAEEFERHNCDTKEQYWQAQGKRKFGQPSGHVCSPTGKSLAFTVAP